MARNEFLSPVSEKGRDGIIREVVERVVAQKVSQSAVSGECALEYVINDTIYKEHKSARDSGKSEAMREELQFLSSVTRNLVSASDKEKEKMLGKMVHHYAEDIAGHFNKNTFRFATRVLPFGLELMFNSFSPSFFRRKMDNLEGLRSRISIRGEVDHVRDLARRGTVIVVPTHSSNLDSVVVGWTLNEVGLPPVNYGAGKNMFSNPIIRFFINSLGAYSVDRLRNHSLYKDTLKMYSMVIIEHGYHGLFFPGGTRSRSGKIEEKLKLGLMGTGLAAYVNNLINGKENPEIYFAPLTINYPIVLEAETLIEDYLMEAGKSRYIIEDDEFSKPLKLLDFAGKLMNMESSMVLNFAPPIDPFGNRVDADGGSIDAKGRPVDAGKYIMDARGNFVRDEARDSEYMREMSASLVKSFRENTVALSTHVLAFTIFRMLRGVNPEPDIYRLLRYEGKGISFRVTDVLKNIDRVTKRLLELHEAGKIQLGGSIRPGECAREITYEALRFFGAYHTRPVVKRVGEKLIPVDRNLLYYYHNRLVSFGLEDLIEGSAKRDSTK